MKYLALLILPALIVLTPIGSSGSSAPRRTASPPSSGKNAAPKSASAQQSNIYSNMKTTETGGHIDYVDPNTGKILWKADFDYAVSQPGQGYSDITARWHGVRGTIYNSGKEADKFTAPEVTADTKNNEMTATGGVVITSLTQADTTLHCDKMVWYTRQNKLIGVGHAVFKKGGITQTMPSFQADTQLKKIVTPAPGLGAPTGRRVHTHIPR